MTFRVAGLPQLPDAGNVPGHVSAMLALFPAGERTLMLALALDYVRARLGRDPHDVGEARHEVGLVLLAADVYGGLAFGPLARHLHRRVANLVEYFGWTTTTPEKAARYLPGHGELRRQVARLLGLAPAQVSAVEVDAAALAVARYSAARSGQERRGPRPFSQEALERFARDQLPEPEKSDPRPVRGYGQLLQLQADLDETDPQTGQLIHSPGLTQVAQVARLARQAAGPDGGHGPRFRRDLEPLLARLFGPPAARARRTRGRPSCSGWSGSRGLRSRSSRPGS